MLECLSVSNKKLIFWIIIQIFIFTSQNRWYSTGKEMIDNQHSTRAMECYWETASILSLLKFFQMTLFFDYLVDYLRQHKKTEYFISFIRVSWMTSTAFFYNPHD